MKPMTQDELLEEYEKLKNKYAKALKYKEELEKGHIEPSEESKDLQNSYNKFIEEYGKLYQDFIRHLTDYIQA